MPAPRRNYPALKETQQQVDDELSAAPAVAPASPPQPEYVNEIDLQDAQRAAFTEVLQEKAGMGRIPGRDVPYWLGRFENEEPIALRHAQDALRLREVREIAEAAAAREEAERAQELELEQDELER